MTPKERDNKKPLPGQFRLGPLENYDPFVDSMLDDHGEDFPDSGSTDADGGDAGGDGGGGE